MAERDKVIKSGQFTLPRILFLGVIGGLIVAMVAVGGIALSIGYWVITLSICVLLYFVAVDYGIKMDKLDLTVQPAQAAVAATPAVASEAAPTVTAGARPKRKGNRPARRRR